MSRHSWCCSTCKVVRVQSSQPSRCVIQSSDVPMWSLLRQVNLVITINGRFVINWEKNISRSILSLQWSQLNKCVRLSSSFIVREELYIPLIIGWGLYLLQVYHTKRTYCDCKWRSDIDDHIYLVDVGSSSWQKLIKSSNDTTVMK